MKRTIAHSVVFLLCVIVSISSAALSLDAISFEASLKGGYSTNLLDDFTQFENYNPGSHLALKFYPTPQLELSGSYDRSWIRSQLEITDNPALSEEERDSITHIRDSLVDILDGLSTTVTGINLTYIPTGANSQLSVYFTGGAGSSSYDGDNFQIYNTTDYDFTQGIGYQYSSRVHLRSEIVYSYGDYIKAEFLDDMVNNKQTLDLVCGTNWSIAGSNVFDMEIGFTEQRFNATFVDSAIVPNFDSVPPVFETIVTSGDNDNTVRSIYFSPRYSGQVGERTGVNLTMTYRSFVSGSDIIVPGEAASLLDPFANVWEGMGLKLSIKTFILPRLITTVGLGYWDKTYLQHLKGYLIDGFGSPQYRPTHRSDEKSSIYFGLQMPLKKTLGGLKIEPSLSVEYGDNSSTIERYNAYGWDLSFGVSLKR